MKEIMEQLKILEAPNYPFLKKRIINNKIKALDTIAYLGSYRDIHYIFKYIFSNDPGLSLAAGEAINWLFRDYTGFNLTSLYESYRRVYINCWADIERFEGEVKLTLLKIATFNHCGYDRERALLGLIKLQGVKALPYIILRSADWVNKIHNLAVDSLISLLKPENISYFVNNIPSIYWMYTVGRRQLAPLGRRIIDFCTETVEGDLERIFPEQESFKNRYYFYKILFEHCDEPSALVKRVVNDSSFMIRGLVINRLDQVEKHERAGLLRKLLKDNNRLNRVRAFWQVKQEENGLFKEELQLLLTDKNSLIRGSIQLICERLGLQENRLFYLDNLSSENAEPAALIGLAECGNDEDITLIKSYLTHKKGPFRAAALRALKYKLGDEANNELIEALNDSNYKVRRTAIKLLNGSIAVEELEAVRVILHEGNLKSRLAAFTVLSNFGRWEVLPDLIIQLDNSEETIRNRASKALSKWGISHYTKPAKRESQRLAETINNLSEESICKLKKLRVSRIISQIIDIEAL